MIGGTGFLLSAAGLALGPLLSLVIFDSRKSRRHLVYDYLVIGVVQIAALVYGVMVVAGARPAYIAFSTDRFEVVAADELRKEERAVASSPEYRDLPWTGPRLVSVQVPPAERSDAMFQALEGNEEHQRPRYYVPLESQLALIQKRAGTLETLTSTNPRACRWWLRRCATSICRPTGSPGCRCITSGDSGRPSSTGLRDAPWPMSISIPTSTDRRGQWLGEGAAGGTDASQLTTRVSNTGPAHSLPSEKMTRSVEASGISPR